MAPARAGGDTRRMRLAPLLPLLVACVACAPPRSLSRMPSTMFEPVRETVHRGQDDLLGAGLGLDGLRAQPPAFADPLAPTPAELRRRAIHANWNGIADLGPLGGYGRVYGGVPPVPGREFTAFARLLWGQSDLRFSVRMELIIAPARLAHEARIRDIFPPLPSFAVGMTFGAHWESS